MSNDFECSLTACIKIEEALRKGDDKCRSLFDFINDGLLILDQDGYIRDVNQTTCESMDYTKDELLGMHMSCLKAPGHNHDIAENLALVRSKGSVILESAHQCKDGRILPVEINTRIVELNDELMFFSIIRDLSERKHHERALQIMQLSVDHMGDSAFWLTPEGRVVYANDAACTMLGYSHEEMLGLHVFDFDPEMNAATWPAHWEKSRMYGSHTLESTHLTKYGKSIPVEISVNPLSYENEEYHCTFVRDISKRKQEQRALKMMQFAMDNMSDAVFWSGADGRIAYANIAACRSLGYTLDEMLSLHVFDFAPPTAPETWQTHWQELKSRRTHTFESMHRTRSGREFPVEISVNYMQYEHEEYICGFARDITLRKMSEDKIARLAHYDTLTGLPNRALLYDRLEQAIAQANRYGTQLAVLFLDLDGFKQVNDNYGHYVGDDLLKAVAERLRENARDVDTVARVGGDEFIFILQEIGQPENAALVAKKIIEALALPFVVLGKPCQIGGSIGIALFPEDGMDMENIIKQADDAMYLAKNKGKGNYQFSQKTAAVQTELKLNPS